MLEEPPPLVQPAIRRQRLKRMAFSLFMLLVTGAILGYLVYRERDVLLNYEWQFHPIPIFASFALFSLALLVVVQVWASIMNTLGKRLPFLIHFHHFCTSNLAKRLPGTVWYIASRAQFYQQDGVHYKLTSIASGIEMGVAIMSNAILALLFAAGIISSYNISPWILAGVLLLIGLMLHPRLIARLFKLLKVEALGFSYTSILKWIGAYSLVWLMGGTWLYVLGNIITPLPLNLLPYIIGSYNLVSLFSSLLFFSPSNLGVTEVGLSLLLSNIVPSSLAVLMVIMLRLVAILYEFIWAGISILLRNYKTPGTAPSKSPQKGD